MLNYKTSSSGQQRWEWGTQLRVVDNFQNSRMTWNALWKIISVILAKQSCSLESFPLNTSFNSVCNNLWKYKWKEVVGPVSAFEVNSLKQRVTVNDCHPCSAHPMLWSSVGFHHSPAEGCAGTASVTSSLQATPSEWKSGLFWKLQKSQVKKEPQPAGGPG